MKLSKTEFDELLKRNPHLSIEIGDQGKAPKLERNIGNGTLAKVQVKKSDSTRFLVCVTSIRRFELDEDNLCEKFHVDCCRYSALIPTDAPSKTKIETTQRKVEKGEDEKIIIEVYKIINPTTP